MHVSFSPPVFDYGKMASDYSITNTFLVTKTSDAVTCKSRFSQLRIKHADAADELVIFAISNYTAIK